LRHRQEQSALKTLILPGEMGERFKVLLLRKGSDGPPLPGRDLRHRL
jgi:SAM-dependent MidA family methyltransferase